MLPTLADKQRLLVVYDASVRVGDLVLARFADGTLVVKRATERRTTATGAPGWWLTSDNPDVAVDSRHRGPVPETEVLARVVARVWPPRVLGRLLGRMFG
jgi:phage repressor protein C with HTH and peptisase S24 domain